MKKSSKVQEWKVGDLVAWESQAAGSYKTKIGRITAMPKAGAKASTTEGKVRMTVLASYPVSALKDVGLAKFAKLASKNQAEGRATMKILRKPTAAELAVIA